MDETITILYFVDYGYPPPGDKPHIAYVETVIKSSMVYVVRVKHGNEHEYSKSRWIADGTSYARCRIDGTGRVCDILHQRIRGVGHGLFRTPDQARKAFVSELRSHVLDLKRDVIEKESWIEHVKAEFDR